MEDLVKGVDLWTGPNCDLAFDPRELAGIYFGCRTPQTVKTDIITKAAALGTPISFFDMRDERIRFEQTPIPVTL